MREIVEKVFSFSELSETAKKLAGSYVIEHMGNDELENDAAYIQELLEMIGFEGVSVHYSIGFCQRDFASFSAEKYSYKKLAIDGLNGSYEETEYTKAVSALAKELQNLQRKAFYKCAFAVKAGQNGRLMLDTYFYDYVRQGDEYVDVLRQFNKTLYSLMAESYLEITSDENITRYADELELEFYEDGRIF